jgi:hypothetical protein
VGLPVWPTVARPKRLPCDRSSLADCGDRLKTIAKNAGHNSIERPPCAARPTRGDFPVPAGREVVSAAKFRCRFAWARALCVPVRPRARGALRSGPRHGGWPAGRRLHEGSFRPRRGTAEHVLRRRRVDCIACQWSIGRLESLPLRQSHILHIWDHLIFSDAARSCPSVCPSAVKLGPS